MSANVVKKEQLNAKSDPGGGGGLGLKRKNSTESVPESSKKPKTNRISKTATELSQVSPEQAQAALRKCIDGVVPPRVGELGYQPNAVGWGPAMRTPGGCIICQKPPNTVS
jgi:hypothetical protein